MSQSRICRRVVSCSVVFLATCINSSLGSRVNCSSTGPRKDCGYVGIGEADCTAKGCCWNPQTPPGVDLPYCFTENTGASAYDVGYSKHYKNGNHELELESVEHTQPELGPDLGRLKVSTDHGLGPDILHVKIQDKEGTRYKVPRHLFAQSGDVLEGSSLLKFSHTRKPFTFSVERHTDAAAPLFNTSQQRLVFKEQYMEISSSIPANSTFYGLGERASTAGLPLTRTGLPITMWNRDRPSRFPNENLYGSFPFLLELRQDGSASGILLLNSNGMDVVLTEDKLSFRVIGGILDLYFFAGPTPADVLGQYTRLVGCPKRPPFWSLGFHQCRYGYKSVEELEEVVQGYKNARIPLDTMWTDIDYMDAWRDFTLDPKHFPQDKMQDFVASLHRKGMKYVVIVDPGIKVDKGYPAYDRGIEADIFIKDITGQPYLGQVWPGATHYPDFLNPATQGYWERELRDFHKLLPFDGIWIDMNEASNFCTGEICHFRGNGSAADSIPQPSLRGWTDCHLECNTERGKSNDSILFPPYSISNANARTPLLTKTLPTTATHFDGSLEYDVHNLYGLAESQVTSAALESILHSRSFALTRSSFPGSGAYVAHWTGDNAATWDDLRWSVAMVLNSGLSGIPFVGADICGFQLDTNEELCARWISAGAFYPFARDHTDLGTIPQELYRWDIVAAAGRKALSLRYRLLSHLHTLFEEAHRTGVPVARPLWLQFPQDVATHTQDQQWMLGSDILVSPVLEQGASGVSAHIPKGVWYDAFTNETVHGGNQVWRNAPLGEVAVLYRGGSIIPLQQAGMNSEEVHRSPFTLVVSMPDLAGLEVGKGSTVATGRLVFEDGEHLQAENSSLTMALEASVAQDDSAPGLKWVLAAEVIERPATDVGSCSGVMLPMLEGIMLLGWPQKASSNIVASIDHHLQQHQWGQSPQGRLEVGNLGIDWRCSQLVNFTWRSEEHQNMLVTTA